MWQTSSFRYKSMNMIDKYYIGWVRSGNDGKGLVKSRPRKRIANAVTTMVGHGILPTLATDSATPRRMWCMSLNRNKIFQFIEQL